MSAVKQAPKRATDSTSKEARRQTILNAAMSLFRDKPASLPTVQLIAKESKLAKGTVYLYFSTKEEIFLALLDNQHALIFNKLEKLLKDSANTPDQIEILINQLSEFIIQNPDWLTLVSLSNNFIEQNIDCDSITRHKQFLLSRIISIGKLIEEKFDFFKPDTAAKLIWRSYALMIGLFQATTPPPSLASIYKSTELSIMTPDFNSELAPFLKSLWRGHYLPTTL